MGQNMHITLPEPYIIGVDVLRKELQRMMCVEGEMFLGPHAEQNFLVSPIHLGG